MRFSAFFAFILLANFLLAQNTVTVRLEGQNCPTKMALHTFDGTSFKPAVEAEADNGAYVFNVPKGGHHFYYVGANTNSLKPILLGQEEEVILELGCAQNSLSFKNSVINRQYEELKKDFGVLAQENQQSVALFRRGLRDEKLKQEAIAMMAKTDEKRIAILDSLNTANPFLAKIASLNTYLSYYNYGTAQYSNEIDYFVNKYFQFVDWKDEAYHELPWVYEGFKSYATTLSKVYTQGEDFQKAVDPVFEGIAAESGAEMLALGGVLTVLRQAKHPSFAYYAQRFIDHFGMKNPQAATDLAAEIRRMASFVIGSEAPDFTQLDVEGNEVKLSDLRGKVVLIDFWASWCGPCRRENPNVVRLYNEYKDQGFEILGVSLDRKKDRWLQAIEKDGLTWPQVSDLKGWQNEAAKMYQVSSIPHTVLLDAEGNILARGLRGAALESKLAELFKK